MENAIFYTFSTIPQVLAGAIALIGVFALYKIQELNNSIIGNGETFEASSTKYPYEREELRKAITSKNYSQMIVLMKDLFSRHNNEISTFEKRLSELEEEMSGKPDGNPQKLLDFKNLERMKNDLIKLEIPRDKMGLIKISTEAYSIQKSKLRSITKNSAIYTAFVIIASIIVLPFTHKIVLMGNCSIVAFFTFSILLVGINLYLLVKIIVTSL